ncbi:Predicted exporter protein [Commensalibacter communis]|uniref:RND superfamily (MMPL) n=1 Tax=Commensalibacter communis TaxID=2972786 RepID=A0A9W4TPF5_9PROT|nr:MMPL family transporter [Commensalibacter communis]CAI3948401.1 Predicted exporter protein [Commensalibacter communis]CAI3951406.1 Predicted exporter protein [Commensalibacter communis]CAI3951596.1 Predicted exporter protein [Commensalibacter communis]CAI3952724.1 Predicted exporter protein [Commensalibacter communis]
MMSAFIGRVVAFCSRHAWFVILFYIVLAITSSWVAYQNLEITTDTSKMFSSSMDWKKRSDQMSKDFPQREYLLVALFESKIPEEGELSAQALVNKLKNDKKHFYFVESLQNDPFLVRNGLLFLPTHLLDTTLNNIIQAQPFLSSLSADPSARGLFDTLGMVTLGVKEKQIDLTKFNDALNGFANILTQNAEGKIQPFSWEKSLSGDLSDLGGKYQLVVAKPKMDLNSIRPSGVPSDLLRNTMNNLPYVKSGAVKVYLTGDAQINDEEFSTVLHGMIVGLFVSFVLVAGWLFMAVRTWRLILPILLLLFIGLVLTTGFASITVGMLNLISISFAILFVSIAVDFGIQFCVRFRGQDLISTKKKEDLLYALSHTGYEAGHQIFTAAVAAAAGFLAFTPTNFIGVKQLGLIAGGGMIIAFICTVTFLPALLVIFRPNIVQKEAGFPWLKSIDKKMRQHRYIIISLYGVLGAIGIFLLADQKVVFDADPFHTKDPHSEGMMALKKMMGDPNTSPYTADIIVNTPQQAEELADKLKKLPAVKSVVWLNSFIPEKQQEKLLMLDDAASILLPTLSLQHPKDKPTAQELRQSVVKMVQGLDSIKNLVPADSPLRRMQVALQKIEKMPDDQLVAINDNLVKFLPYQLERLKTILSPTVTTTQDIPAELAEQYRTKDERLRVEVYPKGVDLTTDQIIDFVKQVRTVAPEAAGTVVDIVESANTVVHSFIVAAIMAIVVLAIILFIALRRVLDMILVMIPLILSALMAIIVIVVIGQSLNFANIITLPLFLGVGVSFNIYFVMNWREGLKNPLSSPTARAVLFSALTTGTAFGALAASAHPGTASMGVLLLISLGCTLVVTLGLVPALLPKRDIDER